MKYPAIIKEERLITEKISITGLVNGVNTINLSAYRACKLKSIFALSTGVAGTADTITLQRAAADPICVFNINEGGLDGLDTYPNNPVYAGNLTLTNSGAAAIDITLELLCEEGA